AKFGSSDGGFVASVVGGGVGVDCGGGGAKDGNDYGMTVVYIGEDSLITKIGNGYLRKGQKSKPKRQNRARERKEPKCHVGNLQSPYSSIKEDKEWMDKIIELGDYSKWRAKIDLRLTSRKKHSYEPSQ
ncbi:hypothetical protein Tco_1399394, partial [Tanacetum coccineum]